MSHPSILLTTSADPGTAQVSLQPQSGEVIVNIDYDLYLRGDYKLEGLRHSAVVDWE